MRETDRRIKKYQARLPRIKEKLIATLLVFVVSASTMAVATFSWLTLSISPEVSGITTTIAANGNLEISLVGADGSLPSSSKVGDSTLNILERNRTWGNLINLSDSSYGLDKIVLRPATLRTYDLLSKPLEAVEYADDGRIVQRTTDFGYAAYNSINKQFEQTSDRGVRAIASIVYDDVSMANPELTSYLERLEKAAFDISDARDYFENNLDINAISGLIGNYMNSILRETYGEEVCDDENVLALQTLMKDVDDNVMNVLGRALVTMFNVYQEHTAQLTDSENNPVYTVVKYTDTDLDTFCNSAVNQLAIMNQAREKAGKTEVTLTALSQFVKDRKQLKADIAKIDNLIDTVSAAENGVYTWGDISDVANRMVNINTVTLNSLTMTEWFTGLGVSKALKLVGMLGDGDDKAASNNVVVHDGLLKNLDAVLHNGTGFYVKKITVRYDKDALKVKVQKEYPDLVNAVDSVSDVVAANIRTDARVTHTRSMTTVDLKQSKTPVEGNISIVSYTAKETYGLALDFWIRTNNPGSYLLLEGDVITDADPYTDTVEYVIRDANGNVTERKTITNTQIYETNITYKTEVKYDLDTIKQHVPEEKWQEFKDSTNEYTKDAQELFKTTIDGKGVWFLKSNGEKVDFDTVETELSYQYKNDNGEAVEVIIGKRTETISCSEDGIVPVEEKKVTGYSGANRVWEEDQIDDALLGGDTSTSTTQGSGSCYIFYADDESQMNQSLELVAAMRVAFIDGDTGEPLAVAYFDTEKAFKEYGRVIVPMYLDGSSKSIDIPGDGTEEAKNIKYITGMQRNEPMQITAILYLDGEKVTNDKVMAATEIEGSLNIQFGSYTDPKAFEDDKLMEQTLTVEATLKSFNAETKEAVVELAIDGSTPTSVTGNFTRIINKTQGTRQDAFDFVPNGGGSWTGTYKFTCAGDFILRTITVDGIDYALKQETLPQVNIEGIGLQSVNATEGLRYVYRTADNYVTERFYINVAAGGQDPYPRSVKGVFIGDNGITITQPFVGAEDEWQADVTFSKSGTYSLNAVIMDGQQYNVETPIVREVYTGLYAKVRFRHLGPAFIDEEEREALDNGGVKYYFVANQEPHDFEVLVEIFDNSNEPIEALGNVKLFYTGIDADLVWDEADQCYSGESFLIDKPGSYSFLYVTVSGQTIEEASSAPTITAATKDPVRYLGIQNEIATSVIELDATKKATDITLVFNNAPAASVYGLFKNQNMNNTSYYVLLAEHTSEDSTDMYTFKVPAIDGHWTLEDVKASNVFDGATQSFLSGYKDENGKPTIPPSWPKASGGYTQIVAPSSDSTGVASAVKTAWYDYDDIEDDSGKTTDYYYNVPIADYADLPYNNPINTTKVIAQLHFNHNFSSVKDVNTGATGTYKDDSLTFKGKTLQSYQLNGVTFKIADFEGMAIEAEDNIFIKLTKTATSTENRGGYTYDGSSEDEPIILQNAEISKTQAKFDITLDTAGDYVFGIEFTVNGKKYTTNDSSIKTPSIVIESDKPTVYISDITLDDIGAYSVDEFSSGSLRDTWLPPEKVDSGCVPDYIYTNQTHEDHIWASENTEYITRIEVKKVNGVNQQIAYLYFKCAHQDVATYSGGTQNGNANIPASFMPHTYAYNNGEGVPRATITLSGIGNATNAKLKFTNSEEGGDVIMITQYTADSSGGTYWGDYDTYGTDSYEWTADGACSRFIGIMDNGAGESGSDTKTTAGTITADQLVLTYNGKTYYVEVPMITIINKY